VEQYFSVDGVLNIDIILSIWEHVTRPYVTRIRCRGEGEKKENSDPTPLYNLGHQSLYHCRLWSLKRHIICECSNTLFFKRNILMYQI
jgi:hypothetical protein